MILPWPPVWHADEARGTRQMWILLFVVFSIILVIVYFIIRTNEERRKALTKARKDRYRSKKHASGKCYSCTRKVSTRSRGRCDVCLKKNLAAVLRYQNAHRSAGLCIACQRPATKHGWCYKHKTSHQKAKNRSRRKKTRLERLAIENRCDFCGLEHTVEMRMNVLRRLSHLSRSEILAESHLWPATAAGDRMFFRDRKTLDKASKMKDIGSR